MTFCIWLEWLWIELNMFPCTRVSNNLTLLLGSLCGCIDLRLKTDVWSTEPQHLLHDSLWLRFLSFEYLFVYITHLHWLGWNLILIGQWAEHGVTAGKYIQMRHLSNRSKRYGQKRAYFTSCLTRVKENPGLVHLSLDLTQQFTSRENHL